MKRIYYPDRLKANSMIKIPKDVAHYLVNVMRLKKGQSALFFNEKDGEFEGKIIGKDEVEILGLRYGSVLTAPKALAFCLIKQNRMNFLIEKATELGASDLYPIVSLRSQVKDFNLERHMRIATEAVEQSGRFDLPRFHETKYLTEFLETLPESFSWYFGDLNTKETGSLQRPYGFIIGPEGGFTNEEREILSTKCTGISMGQNILRAETASLWALSQVAK